MEEKNREQNWLPGVLSILEALLDQAEQPERKQVIRVQFTRRRFAWYFSDGELGLRTDIHEQLLYLEMKGYIKLKWHKYERGNLLDFVDLVGEREETITYICTLLGRTPLNSQRAALQILLSEQERIGGWFDVFLDWAITQLEVYRSPLPLSHSDLKGSRELLQALAAIAQLKVPTLARVISIEIFGNSKRFEELQSKIITVLRIYTSNAAIYGDDEWALLQANNVCRPPEYVPITGPLSFMIKSVIQQNAMVSSQLDIEPGLPSISLSEDILRNAVVTSCPATALITVENQTSFSELLQVRPPSVCVIFTGGFASPALLMFLRAIQNLRSDLPFFHWGDIDFGGFSILAHLRRQLGVVRPLCMDIETVSLHQAYTQRLSNNDNDGLRMLIADNTLADCRPQFYHMLKHQYKLEQEAVRAKSVLIFLNTKE